ncbi:histone-lysine N-methyltransferase SETMAR [Trichonephila clavipes]|nr:histone-lysine N-methyltransferase SETMAR [Trichonephila clavipes]
MSFRPDSQPLTKYSAKKGAYHSRVSDHLYELNADEIVNGVYGADTVTSNYVAFWFLRFRPGIFDVKNAPRTGKPVYENVDKIREIIDGDRHVSSRSIANELKIHHKTVLSHLCKVGFKKKLDVCVPHQLTPKNVTG